jgi:hypothetical protein
MSEEFQDKKKTITLGNDEKTVITLPRLSLKKILALTKAVDTLVRVAKEKSPELFTLLSQTNRDDNLTLGVELVKLAPTLLPVLMDEVSQVIGIYIDKDKEWVEDNMDLEDLVAVATPFFGLIFSQASHVMAPLANLMPKAEEKPDQQETLLQ